jgi:oligosaccharide repeat unit polymerase
VKSGEQIKAVASRDFWRKLFRPETVFLLGTCQALLPYVIWRIRGPNEAYFYDISYIPCVIYIIGYFAFVLGAWLVGRKLRQPERGCPLSYDLLRTFLICLIGLGGVELFLAMKTYGGLPLLNYLEGNIDVWEINARQSQAPFGQLGLLTLTVFILTGIMLIVVVHPNVPSLFSKLLFITYLGLSWLITSMAGKRQGFLMCLFFLLAGVSIRIGNPMRRLLRFVGVADALARTRMAGLLTALCGSLLVLTYVATLGALRTGVGKFGIGIHGITQYMEVPLINFEHQCDLVGFGPYTFSVKELFEGFLPYRTSEALGLGELREAILFPEPTASAGLYGPLHLYTGLGGCILFALLLGGMCKFVYVKARTNDLCLLIYSQCAWPLFVTHSFNLFLILLYVPAPVVAFTCLYGFARVMQRRVRSNEGVRSGRPRLIAARVEPFERVR